jgi:hypothetical protein
MPRAPFYTFMAVLLLSIFGATVFLEAIFSDPKPELREPTWKPPAIEQCDKPLWERVKEGCNDE